jgi:hypothetical protein
MSGEANEPMRLDDAMSLLCQVHLRNLEDDLWSVNMPIGTKVMLREEDYVAAWATLREAVLHRRRLIEEMQRPGYAIYEQLPQEFRDRVAEIFAPAPSYEIRPSESAIRRVVDDMRAHGRTPQHVIEGLFGALLQMGHMLDNIYKNSIELANLKPMSLIIPDPKDE